MAVNTPNPGNYLAKLGQDLVNFRNALQTLMNDANYLNSMGGVAMLEAAPFNMTAADAQYVVNAIGAVTPTNAVVTAINNYLNGTQQLWGGQ
jgi:hypothetical protein